MERLIYLLICPPFWLKTPPLGIEFLKNYLRYQGFKAEIIDVNMDVFLLLKPDKRKWLTLGGNFEQGLFSYLREFYPEYLDNLIKRVSGAYAVGFSLFARNRSFSLSLAYEIKNKYPAKRVVIGGPEVTMMKIKKEKFDRRFFWVGGEGEIPLTKIARGEKKTSYFYEETDDLDTLPFINYYGFCLNNYHNVFALFSSRGCIRKCSFCTERLLYKKFRKHSPGYIIEQIKYLQKEHNARNFVFQDSLIDADLAWLEEIARRIIKEKLDIKWEAQAAVRGDFSLALAKLVKKSGCFNLFVGLESASEKMLGVFNKGFGLKEAESFFANLNSAGLHFEVSMIFGHPQETEKDFAGTIDFFRRHKNIIKKVAQLNPYINYFSNTNDVSSPGLERVEKFKEFLRRQGIRFTNSFINNLVYKS